MKGANYLDVVVLVNVGVISDLIVVFRIIVVASNVVAGDIEIEAVVSIIVLMWNNIKITIYKRNSLPRRCHTC